MEYKVVYQNSNSMMDATEKLRYEVEKLCKQGWKPQGGISISVERAQYSYSIVSVAQAMIKED